MKLKLQTKTTFRIRRLGLIFSRETNSNSFIVRLTTEEGPRYAQVERKDLKNIIRLLSRKAFLSHSYGSFKACDLVDGLVRTTIEDELTTINKVIDSHFIIKRESLDPVVEYTLVQCKQECPRLGLI